MPETKYMHVQNVKCYIIYVALDRNNGDIPLHNIWQDATYFKMSRIIQMYIPVYN